MTEQPTLLLDSRTDWERVKGTDEATVQRATPEGEDPSLASVDGAVLRWGPTMGRGEPVRLRTLADEARAVDTALVVFVPASVTLTVLGEPPVPVCHSKDEAITTVLERIDD